VPEDFRIIDMLRKRSITFSLVVNKIDGLDANIIAGEFHQIGAPQLFTIAAQQGRGVESMIETLLADLPEAEFISDSDQDPEEDEDEKITRIAVIGRPNAGKSTLINALLREDRCVTSSSSSGS